MVLKAPMTTCKQTFTEADNDKAYKLYQSLSKQGVICEDMDQGVSVNNLNGKECPKADAKSCIVGAHDGKVDATEVFEFAFDRYEKYQKIIEGTLEQKLPWVLDDLDPTTSFDAEVRAKVQGAIDKIKGILKSNGVKEGSEEFKEKLAVGLFYLAETPHQDSIRQNKELFAVRFEEESKELDKIGLGEFRKYLMEHGGFRVDGNNTAELTALEALKYKQGECTENSKILFSIYKIAGFIPVFIHVKTESTKNFFTEMLSLMPPAMAKDKQIAPLVKNIRTKLK